MKHKINFIVLMALSIMCISSCKKSETGTPPPGFAIGFHDAVFIVNEGSFGFGNGSVTYYNVINKSLRDDLFSYVNHRPLGDVVQSMNRISGKFYIAVNNSQKIEVVSGSNFTSLSTITGIGSPRYMIEASPGKIYVSDWNDNTVKIISSSTDMITGSIPTGTGPEQMIVSHGKVYVANIGGFSIDSMVTIIDASADTVLSALTVGVNPGSFAKDANGKIWILCSGWIGPDFTGGTADDIAGSLWKINPANDSVETVMMMAQPDHPLKLAVNNAKDELYYLMSSSNYDGKVFRYGINDAALPSAPLVDKTFYGLGVDPNNGNIFGGFVPSFSQKGYMFRYQKSGVLIDSVKAGIAPNGFYFDY